MASVRDKIIAAAPENARLLHILEETDYAISASRQSTSYIQELKREIAVTQKSLKKCSKTLASEHADHKNYRESYMRRLAHRLSRKKEKFEDEASKEEKEWVDAVRVESCAKSHLEQLNLKLAEADKSLSELSGVAQVHASTKKEVDALYKSIFEGPTPGFPQEDEKERQTKQAEEAFNKSQLRMSTETQARAILLDADRVLGRAMADLEGALGIATADAWGVGRTFADAQKQTSLSRVQVNVSQVDCLMAQAQRIQPAIQSIGKLDVAEMHFTTDVVFDNVFSDLNAKDRIRDSQMLLTKAKQKLAKQLRAADERIMSVEWECDQAHAAFNGKREELQRLRAKAIDEIAHTSAAIHAPPEAPSGFGDPVRLSTYTA